MDNSANSDDVSHGIFVEDSAYITPDDVLDPGENSDDSSGGKHLPLREQDRFLPIANVAKIMKRAIPENGKIAKDARECVQECISEFISFITSEASERCHCEKRKTINGEDILFAMNTLGFDNYIAPLKVYLQKYRDVAMAGNSKGGRSDIFCTSVLNDEGSFEKVSLEQTTDSENENQSTGTLTTIYYENGGNPFSITTI